MTSRRCRPRPWRGCRRARRSLFALDPGGTRRRGAARAARPGARPLAPALARDVDGPVAECRSASARTGCSAASTWRDPAAGAPAGGARRAGRGGWRRRGAGHGRADAPGTAARIAAGDWMRRAVGDGAARVSRDRWSLDEGIDDEACPGRAAGSAGLPRRPGRAGPRSSRSNSDAGRAPLLPPVSRPATTRSRPVRDRAGARHRLGPRAAAGGARGARAAAALAGRDAVEAGGRGARRPAGAGAAGDHACRRPPNRSQPPEPRTRRPTGPDDAPDDGTRTTPAPLADMVLDAAACGDPARAAGAPGRAGAAVPRNAGQVRRRRCAAPRGPAGGHPPGRPARRAAARPDRDAAGRGALAARCAAAGRAGEDPPRRLPRDPAAAARRNDDDLPGGRLRLARR